MRRAMSLRSAMTALTLLVTTLVLVVSAALVWLTSVLHRTTEQTATAVSNVRLAQEAQLDLLMHARSGDALLSLDLRANLRGKLEDAERFISSEGESQALLFARQRVEEYLVIPSDPGNRFARERAHEAAYDALDRLVEINVDESNAAVAHAARLDRAADFIGVGAALLLLLVVISLLAWLNQRAFSPVLELASAMHRFGRGELDTRARLHGPSELRQMCERFNDMADALAEQRRDRLAVLGGVAHDLRDPLSVVKMAVSLAVNDPNGDGARAQQRMIRAQRQVLRMERMLSEFLELAKLESGQLPMIREIIDLGALVRETVQLYDESPHRHTLSVRVPEEPVQLLSDPLRIEQVITNLVSNAVKYSPDGSRVEIELLARADEAEICVRDQGVGMSSEELARVFEPFRRVGAEQMNVPGAGLGLFLVKRLVEAHGGRVEASSARGQGSTFRVIFPRHVPGWHERVADSGAARPLPH